MRNSESTLQTIHKEVPRLLPVIPQVFTTALSPRGSLCNQSFTCSCSPHKLHWEWLGRELENSQEEGGWLLGWQDQFTSADGLRYHHRLSDQPIRLYWPNTCIHNTSPQKKPSTKKNTSPHAKKIILTGKEITDMKKVPHFINKNKYTYYVKGSLSSQLQQTIFLNSTDSSHNIS